ncbi:MAG: hypothetical protein N2C14_03585, partial [Planctomycetales bacterium]
ALEALEDAEREELLALVNQETKTSGLLLRVRELYTKAGVFEKASRLVDKYQQRAEAVADDLEPEELRRLFYYLVDVVLDRSALPPDQPAQVQSLAAPLQLGGS